jgi:hypothetical protein
MLVAQSVLVTACLFAFQSLLASCSPLPAGSNPPSPSRSLSGSRSRSPEEHSHPTSHQHEGTSAPSLDFRLGMPSSHRTFQRSQSLLIPDRPSYPGTSAIMSQYRSPAQHSAQGRVPYHRSLSDPHNGLSSIKEEHNPSLDLGLSIGGSSSSSTPLGPSDRDVTRKTVHFKEEGGQEHQAESSKKPRLSHSTSMKESTSAMRHHTATPYLAPQASFSATSSRTIDLHSTPTHHQRQEDHQTEAQPGGPHAEGQRAPNDAIDAEADRFYEIIRNVRNLQQHARATGRRYPPDLSGIPSLTLPRRNPPRRSPPRDSPPRGEQKRSFFESSSDSEGPDYAPAA